MGPREAGLREAGLIAQAPEGRSWEVKLARGLSAGCRCAGAGLCDVSRFAAVRSPGSAARLLWVALSLSHSLDRLFLERPGYPPSPRRVLSQTPGPADLSSAEVKREASTPAPARFCSPKHLFKVEKEHQAWRGLGVGGDLGSPEPDRVLSSFFNKEENYV